MRRAVSLGLIVGTLSFGAAHAYLAPGSYEGRVVVDRWGGVYLCARRTVVPVSKDLGAKFAKFRDRFVKVNVSKVHALEDPGPWRIDAIESIEEDSRPNEGLPVKLGLKVSRDVVPSSDDVIFQILLEFLGGKEARIEASDLMLSIVKKKVAGEKIPGMIAAQEVSDGPSFVFLDALELRYAFDAIRKGHSFSLGGMRISSKDPLTWFVVIRRVLPPGEYEAWVMHRTDEIDGDLGAKSGTVQFAVVGEELTDEFQNRIDGLIDRIEDEECKNELQRIGKPAVPALIEALKRTGIHKNVAYALGAIRDERAIPALLEALLRDDQNRGLHYAAAFSLSFHFPCKEIIPKLVCALNHENRYVRGAAAYALSGSYARAARPSLAETFTQDKDDEVRYFALESLRSFHDRSMLDIFIQALRDDNVEIRETAAMALGELGDKKAMLPLVAALDDKDIYVRAVASGALGRCGDKSAVPFLIKALRDTGESGSRERSSAEKGMVREAAASSLHKLTGQSFSFHAYSPIDEQLSAIQKYEEWCEKNKRAIRNAK